MSIDKVVLEKIRQKLRESNQTEKLSLQNTRKKAPKKSRRFSKEPYVPILQSVYPCVFSFKQFQISKRKLININELSE